MQAAAAPVARLGWLQSSLKRAFDAISATAGGNRNQVVPDRIDEAAVAADRARRERQAMEAAAALARLQQLQASLADTITAGAFAIGGTIALDQAQPLQLLIKCKSDSHAVPSTSSSSSSSLSSSTTTPSPPPSPAVQPVICWQLPAPAQQRPQDREQLMQAILAQCNVATFGRGGETVLDPSYRSAYHLPPSRVVTSFHPAQPGSTVLADIARMLSPADSSRTPAPAAIQAELYNLNVYTTGGLFKAHVDTPRADNMFGSLVVCLPVPHEGGQLTVRHGGQSRKFDWSLDEKETGGSEAARDGGGSSGTAGGSKASQLQWAAFFGNCEHEVAAVTGGYRCTLTYNLYQLDQITSPYSSLGEQSPSAQQLDRQSLSEQSGHVSAIPLIRALREALADGQWLTDGGVVGIKCAHSYAHTSSANAGTRVHPGMLKGVDAAIYSSLVEQLHLRVDVKLVAVVSDEGLSADEVGEDSVFVSDVMQPANNCSDITVDEDNEPLSTFVNELLPHFAPFRQPVTWLNRAHDHGNRELSVAYPTWGNEASSDCLYTEVALLLHVPPYVMAAVAEFDRHVRPRVESDEAAAGGLAGSRSIVLPLLASSERPQSSPMSPRRDDRPQLPACQYGASCYRKNPTHFAQFSHPHIDSENGEDEDDDEDSDECG